MERDILNELRSADPTAQQGYARRLIAEVVVIAKVVAAPDRIAGPIKPLAIAAKDDRD